jgi:DNA-binding SARP family transcriptional activator
VADSIRFRALGPLEILIDGRAVPLGGPRQRAVLLMLLLAQGHPVSVDRLVDAIWNESPPGKAAAAIHVYVARLRKLLGDARPLLASRDQGYALEAERSTVDAWSFDDALDHALAAAADGRVGDVRATLEPALRRWREPEVFGTLRDEPWALADASRLEHRRLIALEILADAELKLDNHAAALSRLEDVAADHPDHEALTRHLMVALYRSGRQGDALAAYAVVRRKLRADLGIEPSPELRELQQQVLAQSPELDWSPLRLRLDTRRLPARNPAFTGREELVPAVHRMLDGQGRAILYGLAGVGKTQLALEVAHGRPGLVAWCPAETEAEIVASLAGLARDRGIPAGGSEGNFLPRLWRHLEAVDDWLLVFDNAEDPGMLARFLPPPEVGRVLITSQNPAWGQLGAPVRIDPFDRDGSLRFILARARSTDAAAAAELAEALGDLPLALEQAAAYVEQTGMTLRAYSTLFTRSRDQLLLRGAPADYRGAVGTTWRLSFDQIQAGPTKGAGLLEVAAYLAPDDLPLSLLAPLFDGTDPEIDSADAVAALLRFSLAQRDGNALRVHRLVQMTMRSRLSPQQRIQRFRDAVDLLVRATPGDPTMPITWPQWAALAPHVIVVAAHADDLGTTPAGLVPLLRQAAAYLKQRASLPVARTVLESALHRAQEEGAGRLLLGEIHSELGDVIDVAGHLSEALAEHERALTLLEAELPADDVRLARPLTRLGHVLNCAGKSGDAIVLHRRALRLLADRSDFRTATTLVDLGYAHWADGDLPAAAESLTEALELTKHLTEQDHSLTADAMAGLGMVRQDEGDLASAKLLQETALVMFIRMHGGQPHPDIAQARDKLGYALRLAGETAAAIAEHEAAARMLAEILGADDPRVAMTLTNLGLARLATGDVAGAVREQSRAHDIFVNRYGSDHPHTHLAAARLQEARRPD